VLPQIMRAYRSTPHSRTLETPNFLIFGRETRVPEHLTYHVPASKSNVHEYVDELNKHMRMGHELIAWAAMAGQEWRLRRPSFV